jgi:hypothetical protein
VHAYSGQHNTKTDNSVPVGTKALPANWCCVPTESALVQTLDSPLIIFFVSSLLSNISFFLFLLYQETQQKPSKRAGNKT